MKYTFSNIKELRTLKIYIITLSDRASQGVYKDLSGPEMRKRVEDHFIEKAWKVDINYSIIPDDAELLASLVKNAKEENADFVFTTGGTGVGPRDITVEAVKPFIDKELPGIMELIRVKYGMKIPHAVLSRGIAGFAGSAQVYTLPGSLKAIKDYMDEILKVAEHLIYMYHGIDTHKKK